MSMSVTEATTDERSGEGAASLRSTGVTSRFERDTALMPAGDETLEGRIDRGWWIERGPNGGYVAALILRGLVIVVDEPGRAPRSFTVHYLAPPAEGPVKLTATVERAGRQLSFVTGRLEQGDRLLALAQAVFSRPVEAPEFDDSSPPVVPPPEELAPTVMLPDAPSIPMRDRYEIRWAIGPLPFTAGDRAEAGGWIRLRDPCRADHVLLAAIADAWLPPAYSRSTAALRRADHRPHRPLPHRWTSPTTTGSSCASAHGRPSKASWRRTARSGAGMGGCSRSRASSPS